MGSLGGGGGGGGSKGVVRCVHCPECVWGIRLLRRRTGAPPLVAVWHGAGPVAYLRLRRPGHPMAKALPWIRTTGARRGPVGGRARAARGRGGGGPRSGSGPLHPPPVPL